MSISKFSKDVVMMFPTHNVIADLDIHEQIIANKAIVKVVQRLGFLGIERAHLLADNSLAVEGYNTLKNSTVKPYAYDVLPPMGKRIVLSHMISQNEERNKLIEGTFPRVSEPFNASEMSVTENNVMNILNTTFSEMMQNEDLPHERKIRIISMVSALTYFKLAFDEKDLMLYESEYFTFLHMVSLTDEEFRTRIEANMDYYWDWANERLEENRTKHTNYSMFSNMENSALIITDDDDEIERDTREVMDVHKLIHGSATKEQQEEVKSVVEMKLNRMALDNSHTHRENSQKNNEQTLVTPTLFEAFQTMNSDEIRSNAELNAQFNTLVKEVEHYMILNAKALKDKYNLIVNFYVSQSTRLFKAMDIKGENKILLNVDLKTGFVDSQFQGQPFKLNGFFNRDEAIKVNVLEW